SNPTVAIAGCTGAVGQELIRLIGERRPALGDIHLLASESSAGTHVTVNGETIEVRGLHGYDFTGTDIAFFAVGAETSDGHVPRAAQQGCLVIDKSSAFRMRPDCPLVVPQVNAAAMAERPASNIIASPNCSTIPLVRALAPLQAAIGVRSAVVSTYQAASGVGLASIQDLLEDARLCLEEDMSDRPSRFPRPLAFNVVPQIDVFGEDGFTVEERKLVTESRKILGDPGLAITGTTVRVPVVNVHSEAVYVQCKRATTREEILAALCAEEGLRVEPGYDAYATPRFNPDPDAVSVGRIRLNPDDPRGVWMWLVADNLRPGAALNALQIAELAMKLSNPR
ncbi:MAG TPA: aspartate-semialdehyde dehydrogenase, partial [Candidatus Krumholzibacteria bacterium]|nr:aspartate-semialdehyde dehydrogenase [Candidatus Krumholzibacteria bacterium]